MTLITQSMNFPPKGEGIRICVMRDPRIYGRHQKRFESNYGRPMYDFRLVDLSPSLDLKNDYKHLGLSWEDYVPRFREEVLKTQQNLLKSLAHLALEHDITFLCSEHTPEHCHRSLLAEACKRLQPELKLILE